MGPYYGISIKLYLGIGCNQGGRCWGTAGTAVHERPGSSTKGRSFQRAFVEPAFGELLENPISESFCRAFREFS